MTVLLVDDNEISLEVQKYMLADCGLTVETAENGEEAVRLTARGRYDLIFMDIQMPDMDGFAAAKAIRAQGCEMPIIALSAEKVQYSDARFLASGMNGSIAKPLQRDALNELLSSYLPCEKPDAALDGDKEAVFDSEGFASLVPDRSAAVQIIEQFLRIHADDSQILHEHISAGNILGARELMHDIVGISGNLYCRKLYDAASRLGADLRRGHAESLSVFTEVWQDTITALRVFCGSFADLPDAGAEIIADWELLWADFLALCGEFDVSAAALFRSNSSSFAAHLGQAEYDRLRRAVDRYDFLAIIGEA